LELKHVSHDLSLRIVQWHAAAASAPRQNQMDQGQKRPSLFPSRNARRGTTCCSGHSLEILSPTTTGALVRPGRRQTRADAGLAPGGLAVAGTLAIGRAYAIWALPTFLS